MIPLKPGTRVAEKEPKNKMNELFLLLFIVFWFPWQPYER